MHITETPTATHALIQYRTYGQDMILLSVGPEALMLAAHEACVEGNAERGLFYSVREIGHDMTRQAAAATAAQLSARQREVLLALAVATKPGASIKPGSRKTSSPDPARWGRAWVLVVGPGRSLYTGDMVAPARKLAARNLVRIDGLDYAPKSYTVTPVGREVARAVLALENQVSA